MNAEFGVLQNESGCFFLIDGEMKSKELAALVHVSPATLAKMKKDGVSVNSDVLIKICTALGCTLDDIVEIRDDEK